MPLSGLGQAEVCTRVFLASFLFRGINTRVGSVDPATGAAPERVVGGGVGGCSGAGAAPGAASSIGPVPFAQICWKGFQILFQI